MDGYLKLMMNLVKLKNVIKFFCISFSVFVFSCESKREKDKDSISSLANLNINKYVIDKYKNYEKIYTLINDSVSLYSNSLLKSFANLYIFDYEIDSMVCINSSNDKLVGTINVSIGKCSNCKLDNISLFLGKKIYGEWYFFLGGGHLKVPRDMYGKDAASPLSFHELSKIARKEMLSGAVIEKNGKLIIDDKWVDSFFYNNGYGKYSTSAQYDSVHWRIIMDKWKHKIDTNEYKPLQRKQFKKNNV